MTGFSTELTKLRITRPTLILDKKRALRNIERMAARAAAGRVKLRPHFKTHQSAAIGRWFRDRGTNTITVSSLEMADYFAKCGWSDITVAFPVNILESGKLARLAESVDLGVLLDGEAAIEALRANLKTRVRAWIKIDTGYGRAGLPWDRPERVLSLAGRILDIEILEFAGLLVHNGLSYRERTVAGVRRVHEESVSRLLSVKKALDKILPRRCALSIGDTPSCSVAEDFEGVDEIRPGNYVFHDMTQAAVGSCGDEDIAVALACPVVGKYGDRGEILIYGGAVHLSTDSLPAAGGGSLFGCLSSGGVDSLGLPDRDAPVVSLTQEHGVVRVTGQRLRATAIGDVVLVFPVHSCLTCNLHREYRTIEGDTIRRL